MVLLKKKREERGGWMDGWIDGVIEWFISRLSTI